MARARLATLTAAVLATGLSGCGSVGWLGGGGGGDHGAYQYRGASAYAPSRAAGWSVEGEVALEAGSSSTFHRGEVIAGALTVEGRDFGDTHDAGARVALRAGRSIGPNTDLVVGVSHASLSSSGPVQVGAVGLDPIMAEFDDYKKTSIDIGVRRYLGPDRAGLRSGALRGFVGASAGVARIDEIDAVFSSGVVGDAGTGFGRLGTGLPNVIAAEFYDDTWTGTAAVTAGLEMKLTRSASLEFETGVQIDGGPDEDDTTLPALGLAQINDSGTRVTIPVALRGKFRF